jgi:hypothetical protein
MNLAILCGLLLSERLNGQGADWRGICRIFYPLVHVEGRETGEMTVVRFQAVDDVWNALMN